MQASPLLSLSPSFNTYSSCRLTEIAARVVEEFRNESEIDYDGGDHFYRCNEESALEQSFNAKPQEHPQIEEEEEDEDEEENEDEDFEFSFMSREPEISPISADEIFYNGQIRPVFPLFNTDLLLGYEEIRSQSVLKPRRMSLGKLMTEERDPPSCSSSEADELEGLQPGTYCVWTPKKEVEKGPGKCKKSNSTGSSKRWRFRDLLHRSNSDGNDTFVFLTPSASAKAKKTERKVEKSVSAGDGKLSKFPNMNGVSGVGDIPAAWGHEAHYARNRAMKEGDKRRSFLPYRQDLVGFLANMNGPSRNLHPF